jgi:mono/diheme cytochrome c family protein
MTMGCSDDATKTEAPAPVPITEEQAEEAAEPDLKDMAEAAKDEVAPTSLEGTPEQVTAELAKRGAGVYAGNCTACHNPDPTQDGTLGPAIAGSSMELLEARVVQGKYPEGYTPKRDTAVMMPLAYLEPELPALHAYLDSLGE